MSMNVEDAAGRDTVVTNLRKIDASDKDWITAFLRKEWGATMMVSRGRIHNIDSEPGFVATIEDEPAGLITYHIEGQECEITLLHSIKEGIGIGRRLVNAVIMAAEDAGCGRLWVITTNDNMHAVGFYQKVGFALAAVYPNALEESRKFKHISRIGLNGIPLRDEIELEMQLNTKNRA